jgi:hypothetical protein
MASGILPVPCSLSHLCQTARWNWKELSEFKYKLDEPIEQVQCSLVLVFHRTLNNSVEKDGNRQPTSRSRVLLGKLTVFQLVKKLPAFYGHGCPLPYSQQPATYPYSEPDQSSSSPPIQFHWDKFFTINFPPTARYSTWHFSVTSLHQNSRCISLLSDKAAQQLQYRKGTPLCLKRRLHNCSQHCWQKRPCKVRQTAVVRNPPLRKLRVTECYKGFWTFTNLKNTALSSVTSRT